MDLERLREDPKEHEVFEMVEQEHVKHCNQYRINTNAKNITEFTDEQISEANLQSVKEGLDAWKTKLREQKSRQ
jgi:cobalamin biosynthesis protein CobT